MKILTTYFIVHILLYPFIAHSTEHKNDSTRQVSRFVLHEGEATDKSTHLVWSRCSVGTHWEKGRCIGDVKLMRLDEAKEYARKLGGGWRVPTIKELYGLAEEICRDQGRKSGVFPDIKDFGEGAAYWSITAVEDIPSLYYYVDFLSGDVDGHSKGFSLAVRLVRDKK